MEEATSDLLEFDSCCTAALVLGGGSSGVPYREMSVTECSLCAVRKRLTLVRACAFFRFRSVRKRLVESCGSRGAVSEVWRSVVGSLRRFIGWVGRSFGSRGWVEIFLGSVGSWKKGHSFLPHKEKICRFFWAGVSHHRNSSSPRNQRSWHRDSKLEHSLPSPQAPWQA